MPKESRFELRICTDEITRWRTYAEAEGQTLAEWVRTVCNEAVEAHEGAEVVAQSLDDKVNPEADPPTRRAVKRCTHGTDKGYHCWQCGGMAEA